MPSASFTREIPVPASPTECWTTIVDFERVTGWVSILRDVRELERLKHYEAVLEDRLGPFRLRADLDVQVSDVEEGRQLRVHAEGEDRQVASQLKIDARLALEPLADENGGTLVIVKGQYEVAGRIATLGAAMITAKANKLMSEFFHNLEKALS